MSNITKFDLDSSQLGFENLTDGLNTLFDPDTSTTWAGVGSNALSIPTDGVVRLQGSYTSGDLCVRIPIKVEESSNLPEFVYMEVFTANSTGITRVSAIRGTDGNLVQHDSTKDNLSNDESSRLTRWKIPVHIQDNFLYIGIEGNMYAVDLWFNVRGDRENPASARVQSVVTGWSIGFGTIEGGSHLEPGQGREQPLKYYRGWNEETKEITVPADMTEKNLYLIPPSTIASDEYKLAITNSSAKLVEVTECDYTENAH